MSRSPKVAVETSPPPVSLVQQVPRVLRSSMKDETTDWPTGVEPGKKMNVSLHSWMIRPKMFQSRFLQLLLHIKGDSVYFLLSVVAVWL